MIWQVVKLSGKWYAKEIDLDTVADFNDVQEFVTSGEVVLLAYSLFDIAELVGIEESEIEVV